MNLRWLWFDHIPPALEVPKEERNVVRYRASLLREKGQDIGGFRQRTLSIWIATFVTMLAAGAVVDEFVLKGGGNLILFVLLLAGVWGFVLWSLSHAPFARRALCERGYLCCVKCGYVHTGLSKDVKECPECGTAREFGKCVHCNSPQDWPMSPHDKCTQCGRMRLS